jgi:glycerol uptake facilitator-like aquaporin
MISAAARRALAAEALGTALLVAGVVGSGIMAERLTRDPALALLCNTLATGALLTVLILIFAPVSKAHFNPVVSLVFALRGEIAPSQAFFYIVAQIGGAVAGTAVAHLMFAMPLLAAGLKTRSGLGIWVAEGIATFGLVLTILGTKARGISCVAASVGLYIAAAYWFTSSTSFANPAVTIARSFTATFAGIRPADVAYFIGAQMAGALLASAAGFYLFADSIPRLSPVPAGGSGGTDGRPAPWRGA